jgi:hypothetical protein
MNRGYNFCDVRFKNINGFLNLFFNIPFLLKSKYVSPLNSDFFLLWNRDVRLMLIVNFFYTFEAAYK